MGFYECVYECGCVDMSSSFDGFASPPEFCIICDKHKMEVRNEIHCNLLDFVLKFKKNDEICSTLILSNATIINIHTKTHPNKRSLKIYQLEIDYDCGKLDQTKIIYFSELDDVPSWKLLDNGKYLITIPEYLLKLPRVPNRDNTIYYDWSKNKVIKMSEKEIQKREEDQETRKEIEQLQKQINQLRDKLST
jgi:hypothetical protein